MVKRTSLISSSLLQTAGSLLRTSAWLSFLSHEWSQIQYGLDQHWNLWSLFRRKFVAESTCFVYYLRLHHKHLRCNSKKETLQPNRRKGYHEKIAIFVIISLFHILDSYLPNIDSALEVMSTIFYLSNEGIRILENAGQLGLPLPEKIATVLSNLKSRSE